MNNKDKICRMDGLPGITIPGCKGDAGVRGSEMIFAQNHTTDQSHLNFEIVVDGVHLKMTSINKPIGYKAIPGDFIMHTGDNLNTIYSITKIQGTTYTCIELDSWKTGDSIRNVFDINIVMDIKDSDIAYSTWDGTSAVGDII